MPKLQPHRVTAWLLLLAVMCIYVILGARFPLAYIWATYEDMYGEWIQFYLFVAVTACAGWLTIRGPAGYRLFFLALALAGFYTVGEEISWGQRLMGVDSPEFFEEYNIQGETNLHNFLTGPISSVTGDIVKYVLCAGLFLYGAAYPALLMAGWSLARRFEALGIAPPPLYLAPFFLLAIPLELGVLHFNLQEIAEMLVGIGMLCTVLFYACRPAPAAGATPFRVADQAVARRLAQLTGVATVLIVVLATATTVAMYSNPEMRAGIDKRRQAGMSKYAERYDDVGAWSQSAQLLQALHEAVPGSLEVLRRLTLAYEMAGDTVRYRESYARLLEKTAARAPPLNTGGPTHPVAAQLSLAESYRSIGDEARYAQQCRDANTMAIRLAESEPGNPEAAYWLGRSYQQLGEYQQALKAYDEARQLAPDSAKYANAYRMLARQTGAG